MELIPELLPTLETLTELTSFVVFSVLGMIILA